MKKSILNLGTTLNKSEQKAVNGGMRRCASLFFCAFNCDEGDPCAIPNGLGGANRGTIVNGQCCL
ncbi:hypothetical protein [uncultured Tenacibaculum sp.]|uniref:hypothetical protein n=1 Tax=uncultured Tenacibaculum sp. TaxID=174713 RepID=UPI00261D3795|nr:hypothetical protein [uncultured Tenacibaculum sp.]